MAVLRPLDPNPLVRVGEYDFQALAAGRTPDGLAVSVQVANGVVCWADTVLLALQDSRAAAAGHIATASGLSAGEAAHGLLQLLPKVEGASRAGGASAEWQPPLPLGAHAAPSFPVESFPPWLRDMVIAQAKALQVPVDLPAMLALAVLGTAVMKKAEVRVRSGYYLPLNSYVLVGLDSGERKSPAYRAMIVPIIAAERELTAAARRENEGRAISKQEPLPLPQLFADDITTEQVPVLLEQNGERLAILSDEGDALDIMAGRYSRGTPNFGVYLRAWDGSPYKVNRGMRPPIYLHHPLLSLGLCVQPTVITGLAETPAFRGRGLLARFWFSVPISLMGARKPTGPVVPRAVCDEYERRMRALLDRPVPEHPAVWDLSPAAHDLLVAYATDLEPRLGPDGDLRGMKDWAGKSEGSLARLAGLLHACLPDADLRPISAETIRAALAIAQYLLAHAQAAFGLMKADPHLPSARTLLRWIRRKGLTEFSRRDAYCENPSHFERPDDCMPGLAILTEHGYIAQRPSTQRGPGRPATPMYDVNPAALESDSQYSQNSQNPSSPEETPSSENSQNTHDIPPIVSQNTPTPDPDVPPWPEEEEF